MSSTELKMQPTIHLQSRRGYFRYSIVLKSNYEYSIMTLFPIILFITTDIYQKIITRLL
jgi:hypothetical protein